MALDDFHTLLNLKFYDEYKPIYVYFNSLLNYKRQAEGTVTAEEAEAYNRRAEEVAAEGTTNLHKGFLDISQSENKDSLALIRLQGILDILKKAIDYERKNEIEYFKQKYRELEKAFENAEATEELKMLHSIMDVKQVLKDAGNDPTKFDYSNFLVLINSLLTNVKTTKALASYEEERLKEVEDAMDTIMNVHKNRLIGITKKIKQFNTARGNALVTKGMQKFERKIENQWLTEGTLSTEKEGRKYQISGVKRYLEPVKTTVDVAVAHWITDQLKAILSSQEVMKEFESKVHGYYIVQTKNTLGWQQIEQDLKEFLIKMFLDYGARHMPEIIAGAYKDIDLKELVDEIQSSFSAAYDFNIKGFRPNFGEVGLNLELFDAIKSIEDLEKSGNADQLFEALSRLYTRLNKYMKNRNRYPLTKEQANLIKSGRLTGDDSEFKEMMKLIRQLDDMLKSYEKALEYNEKVTKEIRSGNRHIKGLNGKDIKFRLIIQDGDVKNLDQIKDLIMQTVGYTKINKTALTSNDFKYLVRGLKARASYKIKNVIIAELKAEQAQGKNFQSLLKLYKEGLEGMTISITGPSFQEVRDNIFHLNEKGMITNFNPNVTISRKNDSVVMVVKLNDEEIAAKMGSATQENAVSIVTNTVNDNHDNFAQDYNNGFTEYFMKELKKLDKDPGLNRNSPAKNAELFFNWYRAQEKGLDNTNKLLNKFNAPIRKLEQQLRKEGKTEEEIKEARINVLNSLKDTFFISSTMKTRVQYQKDLGFGGGSIGSDLLQQILNIADIFEEAGQPLEDDDIDWLYSSIINCFPGSIVSERNKDTIQNYIGALAAFLLFDEGGAELQIINNLEAEIQDAAMTNSPSILHLYNVNGIYVPGSVVLERTWQDLDECLTQCKLATRLKNHGASVMIHNPLTETNIPNRGTKGKIVDKNPWKTIALRANKDVSIKVMFLGGLLDILNSMNNKMLGIQLPSK